MRNARRPDDRVHSRRPYPPSYLPGVRLHPDGRSPSPACPVRCWERVARDPDGRDTLRLAHLGRGVALGSRLGADNWPPDPLDDWWGLADGGDRLVQPYAWVARQAPAGAGAFEAGPGQVRGLLAARRWRVWDFIGSLLDVD